MFGTVLITFGLLFLIMAQAPYTTGGNTAWYIKVISPEEGEIFTQDVIIKWTIEPSPQEGLNFSVWIGHTMDNLSEVANGTASDFMTTINTYQWSIKADELDEGIYTGKIVAWKGEDRSETAVPSFSVSHTIETLFSVSITSPADGSIFDEGDSIHFSASITGNYTSITWESDVDGILSHSPDFSLDNLSAGDHRITVTAHGGGKIASDHIILHIRKKVTILPMTLTSIIVSPDVIYTDEYVNITVDVENPNNVNISDVIMLTINDELRGQMPKTLPPSGKGNVTYRINFSSPGPYILRASLKSDPSMMIQRNITVIESTMVDENGESGESNSTVGKNSVAIMEFLLSPLGIIIVTTIVVISISTVIISRKKNKTKKKVPKMPEIAMEPHTTTDIGVNEYDTFDKSIDNWVMEALDTPQPRDDSDKKTGSKEKKGSTGKKGKGKSGKKGKKKKDEFDDELKAVMEEVFK